MTKAEINLFNIFNEALEESRSGWEVVDPADKRATYSNDHYYHVTPRKNTKKILKIGLDPKHRRPHGTFDSWFGADEYNNRVKDKVYVAKNTETVKDMKDEMGLNKLTTLRIHRNLVDRTKLKNDPSMISAAYSQERIKADPKAYKRNKEVK